MQWFWESNHVHTLLIKDVEKIAGGRGCVWKVKWRWTLLITCYMVEIIVVYFAYFISQPYKISIIITVASGTNNLLLLLVAQLCPTLCNPMDCSKPDFLSFMISRCLLRLMSLSQWGHPTIPSSVILFSSCLQSFLASGSFLMSQHFVSGGQGIGASASVSVLPMNIQDWFPLGLTGLNSLKSTLKSLLHHSSKASNGLKETNNREHLLSNYYV